MACFKNATIRSFKALTIPLRSSSSNADRASSAPSTMKIVAADRSAGSRRISCAASTNRPSAIPSHRFHGGVGDRRIPRSRGREAVVAKPNRKDLVMGQVKILRRGEKIADGGVNKEAGAAAPVQKKREGSVLGSTDPIGPEPAILPVQMKIIDQKEIGFAGSGFLESPAPSALPKPSFMKKDLADSVDLATKSLRYLLRLDVI